MEVKTVKKIKDKDDYCFFEFSNMKFFAYLRKDGNLTFTKAEKVVNGSRLSRRLYKNKIDIDLGSYLVLK